MPRRQASSVMSVTSSDDNWSNVLNSRPLNTSSMPRTSSMGSNQSMRSTGSSAVRVNLGRYQSDASWSSVSAIGSNDLPNNEDPQIAKIKLECLQAMKEKRRQVKFAHPRQRKPTFTGSNRLYFSTAGHI